jgi:hypothetical protein
MKTILLLLAIVPMFSCAPRKEFIMDAEVVSMTKAHVPKGYRLKSKGTVDEKWCKGDEAIETDSGELGYMDQVILKAQEAGQGDFIMDARFYWVGSECMSLSGEAAVAVPRGGKANAGGRKRRNGIAH